MVADGRAGNQLPRPCPSEVTDSGNVVMPLGWLIIIGLGVTYAVRLPAGDPSTPWLTLWR